MWTSDRAVLRDLSLAQGGFPSAAAASNELRTHTLQGDDRPPRLTTTEETEEEYIQGCAGDGVEYMRGFDGQREPCETKSSPDLRLIQQMLNMVHKVNIIDEKNHDELSRITKHNTYSITAEDVYPGVYTKSCVYTPGYTSSANVVSLSTIPELPEPKTHKKKRHRNIAIESILQGLENNKNKDGINCKDEQVTLLKPCDLVTKRPEPLNNNTCSYNQNVEDTENISQTSCNNINYPNEKVNNWIMQKKNPIPKTSQRKQVVRDDIHLDPASMFKKKILKRIPAKPCPVTDSDREIKNHNSISTTESKLQASDRAYIPPIQATQCYQRYLEKLKVMKANHDNIWTKVEKEIKKLEEKRRELAAAADVELPDPGIDASGNLSQEPSAGPDVWNSQLQRAQTCNDLSGAVLHAGPTPVSWEALLSDDFQCSQRYLEKSKTKAIHDDICTQAEKKMKQLDENRRELAATQKALAEATDRRLRLAAAADVELPDPGIDASCNLSQEPSAGPDIWNSQLLRAQTCNDLSGAVLHAGPTPVSWETLLSDASD